MTDSPVISSTTPLPQNPPRTAIVHDWLTGMRGGERCLEVFAKLQPAAPILTLVHEPGSVSATIEKHPIRASALSRWPFLRKHYRKLLPFFPYIVDRFPSDEYDLLFSLSHCAAKAVPKRAGAKHVCYCFTPARYLWDLSDTYLDRERTPLPVRLAAEAFLPELQRWDRATAESVDEFIAISQYVAERILRIYGRRSRVIYPPVDCGRFAIAPPAQVGEHYLMVTALAPYKGVDLAIRAFNRLGKKLVIIGSGQDEKRVRALAGPTIEFRGWIDDDAVTRAYREARAFLLPCDEDFGITPLESMASGRPVIALGRGGALETVVAGQTGMFFPDRSVDALCTTIEDMEREHDRFDPAKLRDHAWSFDVARFRAEIAGLFEEYGAEVPIADRAAARSESSKPA